MHFTKGEFLRFLALLALYGTTFTFLSTAYASQHVSSFSGDYAMGDIERYLRIRHIPRNITMYGFPASWLINVEGTTYVGWQVIETYSELSICWLAFLGDILFYAVVFSPVVYFRFLTAKSRRPKPSTPTK